MRLILALALIAGCADATDAFTRQDGGGPGTGHRPDGADDGVAPDAEGGTTVPPCNAALETLNGRATYVPGSLAAVAPTAPADAQSTTACGDWVPSTEGAVARETNVVNGAIGTGGTTEMVAAIRTDTCIYTLRRHSVLSASGMSCAVTVDYALSVP